MPTIRITQPQPFNLHLWNFILLYFGSVITFYQSEIDKTLSTKIVWVVKPQTLHNKTNYNKSGCGACWIFFAAQSSASSELECFLVRAALCSVGATNCIEVQRRKILHQIHFSQLLTRTLRVRVARKCYCSTLATCPQHKKEESKSPSLIEEARCCLISPTDCLRGSCQPAGCSWRGVGALLSLLFNYFCIFPTFFQF